MDHDRAEVVQEFAPGGRLRVAINFGNAVLAQADPATGAPRGVSVDLAGELARRLGVALHFVTFDAAGKVFAALQQGQWDVAFLAIDPHRAAEIDFTAPYVIIEGGYVVHDASPLHDIGEVDGSGVRIAVARGSAYELYLSRTIAHAEIVRVPSGDEAKQHFLSGDVDVLAGVKGPLIRFAAANPGLRVLPGRFMQIEQAMGVPKGRSRALALLRDFVEDVKASGFVRQALDRSGQHDAAVADPAGQ